MSEPFDVVGVGANSIDRVSVLPGSLHALGLSGKMRIREQQVLCGGQTATALRACAGFGLRTCYVGAVGADSDGKMMRGALERHGVDTSRVVVRDTANATAVILVDGGAGHRIVLWQRDEHLRLEPHEIPADVLRSARVVHVDDVDQAAAIRAARLARDSGVRVTSDIEQITENTGELIASVTFPIFDERAPLLLTGASEPEQALRALRLRHDAVLCMTLGERGALALEGDRLHAAPPFQVPVVDTTGAGDIFRAGFMYGVLHRWPVPQTLRFANAAAALSCTRLGAFDSAPSIEDVRALLA